MRLVLPIVVAWIGIQYTAFSFANLCSNGNVAAWCEQPAAMLSEHGELPPKDRSLAVTPAGPEEEADESDETAPASDQKPPGVEESGGKSGEKAPKQDDILYDSV
jgi:NSS family neurotransmitter:Na+ symporter